MPSPSIKSQVSRKLSLRFPWQKPVRSSSAPAATTVPSDDSEHDVEQERLQSLNSELKVLACAFPDVRPNVFRELLSSFSGESRLHLVAEALLMNHSRVVQGRWRSFGQQKEGGDAEAKATARGEPAIASHDLFRSEGYKAAVKAAFYEEFPSLSRSAIRGVLAEQNYSYTQIRPLLLQLNSQSWRASLANLFYRRKLPSLLDHPLVAWRSGSDDSVNEPMLRSTSCAELNDELSRSLIDPVREKWIENQVVQDLSLAEELNESEAEAADATYDCQCCFTPNAFERISVCSDKGHYLCFRCLRHTMSEALYGQGWAQSIDTERCTIMCIAPCPSTEKACTGFVPQYLVKRAILGDKGGSENWQKFESKLLNDSLKTTEIQFAKCPFCDYAEVEVDAEKELSIALAIVLTMTFIGLPAIVVDFYVVKHQMDIYMLWLLSVTLAISVFVFVSRARRCVNAILGDDPPFTFRKFYNELVNDHKLIEAGKRKPNDSFNALPSSTSTPPPGLKRLCRNPTCLTPSCAHCHAPWLDPHTCHPARHLSLRTHVEAALTAATTRTCPLCQLSFIKSSGCNKLECPCGYRMCYPCRKDVRSEGYAHFCGHFRASGTGECPVRCGRCDLYRDEFAGGGEGEGASGMGEGMEGVKRRAEEEWLAIEAGKDDVIGGVKEKGLDEEQGMALGSAATVGDYTTVKRRHRWQLLQRDRQ